MSNETLEWLTFMVTALGSVFMGISALKPAVTLRKELPLSMRIYRLKEPKELIVCPNCGQPFDVSFGFRGDAFPRINSTRMVTCPRCWLTFEA